MSDTDRFKDMEVYIRAKNSLGTVEEYRNDGLNGPLHNDDGPAVKRTADNGVVFDERYYRDGKPHRSFGPAVIERRMDDGSVSNEEYYREGQLHRDDGPAQFRRDSKGKPFGERFVKRGKVVDGTGVAENSR